MMYRVLVFVVLLASLCACKREKVEPEPEVQKPDTVVVEEPKPEPKPKLKVSEDEAHTFIIEPDTTPIRLDTLLAQDLESANDSMTLRILSIGNSYSRDAMGYVPLILNELMPKLRVQFEIMYYGGRPLVDHESALRENRREYQRDIYTSESGMWHTEHNHTLTSVLDTLQQWDLVIFQQASGSSPSYSTYQPYLHNLVTQARTLFPDAKIAWMLTPAHPDGYAKMPTTTSLDMWELICDASEQAMSDEQFDLLIPVGTAIQNARMTPLDSIGDFGHMSADGLHLQDGLPCLIASYTVVQKILEEYMLPHSVIFSDLRPTQKWVEAKHVPQPHGIAIEGGIDDYILCKHLALRAVNNPFKLYLPQHENTNTITTDSIASDSIK